MLLQGHHLVVIPAPLDEKGVTILFSDNKAIACTTKFMRDIIEEAIRSNHAKVVFCVFEGPFGAFCVWVIWWGHDGICQVDTMGYFGFRFW